MTTIIKSKESKAERQHILNDHLYKHISMWERARENEIRHKLKKKQKNRAKRKANK